MRLGLSPHGAPALFREDAQRRLLFASLGISIMLHTAVLVALPGLQQSPNANGPKALTATIASKPTRPEDLVSAPKPLPQSRREANPQTPQPVFDAPESPAEAIASQADSPPLSAPTLDTANTSPSAPAIPAASAETHMVEGADPNLLEKYRLALIDAVKRYKRYPTYAMERGWQGRVEVRLVVGSNGAVRSALIKRSSNYRILDDQALDMVKKGTGREPIPSALHGREFTLDIPVIFELQTG